MSSKRFSIGIDLGTSNSAVSVFDSENGELRSLPLLQVIAPDGIGEKQLLPSVLYLPFKGETLTAGSLLPWDAANEPPVGQLAREKGALLPDRLVSSAKSWLCSRIVDPTSPVLPWGSPIEEPKLSPVDASTRILRHLLHAAAVQLTGGNTAELIEASEVVLTVPASFDEVARALTHQAAESAGWGNVTMFEEPQAAFYSWIAGAGADWRKTIAAGDLVLVVDVGGGTADFSLIAVTDNGGELELTRVSVGEHILLGGDNMDLTLAYMLQQQIEGEGHTLDQWQFQALIHAARAAKERLLGDENLAELPIAVPSRGSSLFASTITTVLSRESAMAILLDGFFPLTEIGDVPATTRALGLREWGLDYAADPAVSKHLARFLARSYENLQSDSALAGLVEGRLSQPGQEGRGGWVRPTAVLFNGGVFEAGMLRARVMEILSRWSGGERPRELTSRSLDLAVSRGAAQYGAVRLQGQGVRIRAGLARSYYLGLATSMPAVPGFVPPVKGLCVVPQGTEEGTELVLEGMEFGLVTGEPVEFRFFGSAVRAGDEVGAVVPNAVRDLEETARLRVTLAKAPPKEGSDGSPGAAPSNVIPVKLHSIVTDVGTLELWMQQVNAPHRWKLEFNVRNDAKRS